MLPRNATHCLHTLHLDVFADIWFVNYIYSKFEIMAPNSQALKSLRIKNWKIVPFNSFCHPALIAWKWNKIIYGCDCQSVVFFGPTVRWDSAFCFDFQKLNTRWFGRWPSCQRHMQYHNWCSANHLYMHRSVWPAFGEVLVFRTVEFSPLSLSALSHSLTLSLYGQCLACPFSVPEPKQRSWP